MAASALQAGALIAVRGWGYRLMCDARNEQSVARLRMLKRRKRKPLAVMMGSLAEAKLHVTGSEDEVEAAHLSGQTHHLAAQARNDDRPQNPMLTTKRRWLGIAPASPP